MEIIELIGKVRIFHGLSETEMEQFAAMSAEEIFPKDTVIIEENTEGRALYIVKRGTVSVSKVDGEVETELTKLVAGEAFGEMSLIEDAKTSARVTAYNEVECLVIGRDPFLELMSRDDSIAARVYKNFTQVLSERLRATSRELSTWKPDIEF